MVIIENIVEDLIDVQYEDESTTHNPQVLVDMLKMTTQYVDFLQVKNFNFIINLCWFMFRINWRQMREKFMVYFKTW